jgi:hypothetical protein
MVSLFICQVFYFKGVQFPSEVLFTVRNGSLWSERPFTIEEVQLDINIDQICIYTCILFWLMRVTYSQGTWNTINPYPLRLISCLIVYILWKLNDEKHSVFLFSCLRPLASFLNAFQYLINSGSIAQQAPII